MDDTIPIFRHKLNKKMDGVLAKQAAMLSDMRVIEQQLLSFLPQYEAAMEELGRLRMLVGRLDKLIEEGQEAVQTAIMIGLTPNVDLVIKAAVMCKLKEAYKGTVDLT
jgi:hypothetical protein